MTQYRSDRRIAFFQNVDNLITPFNIEGLVLNLNKIDTGNRTFLLCTNDEEIDRNGDNKKHKI